jgi:RNA polymerase sigma-70 factor (ECF subfamily)
MQDVQSAVAGRGGAPSDEELVERARRRDSLAFELLMRRHNQRVYRVVRSVLRDPSEVEDVMQQAYLSAFVHLDQFAGAARWSTWVCRIALNEALGRVRQRDRFVPLEAASEADMTDSGAPAADPEEATAGHQVQSLLEEAVDRLPEMYRTVLVLRAVEGMSTAETAAVLEVPEDVVKTRLHRARTSLRASLSSRVERELVEAYAFGNERCDRVVAGVLAELKVIGR